MILKPHKYVVTIKIHYGMTVGTHKYSGYIYFMYPLYLFGSEL